MFTFSISHQNIVSNHVTSNVLNVFSLLAKTLTKEVFKRHKILLHSATGGQKKHKFSRVCSLKKKG